MARYRKATVAALAASALLLTSGAAYAGDLRVREPARQAPSMSWAYYSGKVTDLSPNTHDVYDGARATAMMISIDNESTFRVTLRGLSGNAMHKEYGAHLHTGPCGLDGNGQPTVGGHYNTTPAGLPLVVNDKTEVWLNFQVHSVEYARAAAVVPFVPEGSRSITFHEKATVHHGDGAGTAGPKLACIPLDIKKVGGAH